VSNSATGARTQTGSGEVSRLDADLVHQALHPSVEAVRERLREERRLHPERFPDPATETGSSAERRRRALVAHGVPIRYAESRWEDVNVVEAAEWKAGVLLPAKLKAGKGLLLPGPVGTGKSSIAALVCGEALELGHTVGWEQAGAIVDEMNQGKDAKVAVQIRCRKPYLLVIDDFGVSALAPWEVTEFEKIIDARYRLRRSTIITTNTPTHELAADPALGRMVSRWRQNMRILQVDGPDRRKPEAD
jgi:DNA replication protein DnaC